MESDNNEIERTWKTSLQILDGSEAGHTLGVPLPPHHQYLLLLWESRLTGAVPMQAKLCLLPCVLRLAPSTKDI